VGGKKEVAAAVLSESLLMRTSELEFDHSPLPDSQQGPSSNVALYLSLCLEAVVAVVAAVGGAADAGAFPTPCRPWV
jgi:hypothetical protein